MSHPAVIPSSAPDAPVRKGRQPQGNRRNIPSTPEEIRFLEWLATRPRGLDSLLNLQRIYPAKLWEPEINGPAVMRHLDGLIERMVAEKRGKR